MFRTDLGKALVFFVDVNSDSSQRATMLRDARNLHAAAATEIQNRLAVQRTAPVLNDPGHVVEFFEKLSAVQGDFPPRKQKVPCLACRPHDARLLTKETPMQFIANSARYENRSFERTAFDDNWGECRPRRFM